jgi:hypothetical protein
VANRPISANPRKLAGEADGVSSAAHDLAAPGREVPQDVVTPAASRDPGLTPDDGLAGPVIGKGQHNPAQVHGGAYAPYMIERWTRVRPRSTEDGELDIYYVLSTWNPYVVVLMTSRLRITGK